MSVRRLAALIVAGLLFAPASLADGPKDNLPDQVRPIPPVGVELSAAEREELDKGLGELNQAIGKLRERTAKAKDKDKDKQIAELLPDVEIFHRAVRQAVDYREFFDKKDIPKGKELLATGLQRAHDLLEGDAPWTRQTGLVARGFVSRLDGTVQPYGLVIPPDYSFDGGDRYRLDVWLHGRGETVCEVNFLDQRQKQVGNIQPPSTIVLHPFGRYSNAFKLAGEIDVFEALEAAQKHYRVDDRRIVMRGFSMGGAGVWHLAVHYPDRWVAATPGAGFSETPQFLHWFQNEKLAPAAHEQTLWKCYNCDEWVRNLMNCPTIAYSGEIDTQKQAADVMAAAARRQGMELTHIIGPQTKHKIHPDSLIEIERRLASIVQRGRDVAPREIDFTTFTLRYNRMAWLELEALGEHWRAAHVVAHVTDDSTIELRTENVLAVRLAFPSGYCPLAEGREAKVIVDGQPLSFPGPETDRSWTARLARVDSTWKVGAAPEGHKRPGLQGPIDDALLDPFVYVRPTGKPRSAAVDKWAHAEMDHAEREWRRQFRGAAPIVDDTKLDDATIAAKNLILWGDPGSNAVLAKLADKLPIPWNEKEIQVGDRKFDSEHHALMLVMPNPLNPEHYVVINSGPTFREYDYLSNARQVPKLPDWAVIDVRKAPDARWPGEVVAADFFDEAWQVKPDAKK